MDSDELSELNIQVQANDATEEDVDRMTRELLAELRDMDVERVELTRGASAPTGTKSVDPVTTGSLMVAVLPALLPKLVDGVQAWVSRGSNRSVKFKGRIAGQAIEFEGSPEDLHNLLNLLDKRGRKR